MIKRPVNTDAVSMKYYKHPLFHDNNVKNRQNKVFPDKSRGFKATPDWQFFAAVGL
jgi:hypothetical protein